MFTAKTDSVVKETLKCICSSYEWCYGVFWGFDQKNSLLLTLKDAYYEQQMEALVDDMLLQVHVLGGGEIGQAALSQNQRWIYSDAHHEIQDQCLHDSEFFSQFTLGMKTIALISVEPWGVVQFGSTKKIPETNEFSEQVRQWFKELKQFEKETAEEFESLIMEQNRCSLGDHFQHNSISTNELDQLLLDQSLPFFDCSDLTSQMKETSAFLQPTTCDNSFTTHSTANILCEDQSSRSYGLHTLDELFRENDFSEAITMDDPNQWCSSNSAALFSTTCSLNSDLSNVTGLIPLPDVSCSLNSPINASDNIIPKNTMQSSITDAYESNHRKSCNGIGYKNLERLEVEPEQECTNTLDHQNAGTRVRDCETSNSLFSKLGLDQLLDGNNCSFGSDFSAKRRKVDYSWIHGQEKTQGRTSFDVNDNKMLNMAYELQRKGSIKSEACTEEEGSIITGDTKGGEKFTTRTGKKRAKSGTKPRPKDRQMIQDRLAELRQLVPNGEKMSIDRLLERTIRHMNYMQSLTKNAEILRQSDHHNPKVQQPSLSTSNNGVTWACEVGDQSVVCPLIVEDLTAQGQLLIEILYEEQGFFLEIVNVIRSFGLIILKGVMEDRGTKIWARFIVEGEGKRCVSRHEIFSSLIQLLQMTQQNATHSNDNNSSIITSEPSLFNNFQPSVSFPVNALASIRQCS